MTAMKNRIWTGAGTPAMPQSVWMEWPGLDSERVQPEFRVEWSGQSIQHSLVAGLVPLTQHPGLGLGIDAGPADERVVGLEGVGDGLEGVLP